MKVSVEKRHQLLQVHHASCSENRGFRCIIQFVSGWKSPPVFTHWPLTSHSCVRERCCDASVWYGRLKVAFSVCACMCVHALPFDEQPQASQPHKSLGLYLDCCFLPLPQDSYRAFVCASVRKRKRGYWMGLCQQNRENYKVALYPALGSQECCYCEFGDTEQGLSSKCTDIIAALLWVLYCVFAFWKHTLECLTPLTCLLRQASLITHTWCKL